jgi:CheY-like chemotaxis protein
MNENVSVIVVDSDRDARELYRESLASCGVRVHEAADGREALAQVYSHRPDAIVLDARLPFIDGLQLCTILRNDAATASLRIIAITSDGAPQHIRRFRDGGADLVLVKPVRIDELTRAVRDRTALTPARIDSGPRAAAPALPKTTRTVAKARSHERYVSTNPPQPPPRLRCPQCDSILQYERSHIGGVSERHPEQWDYYVCAAHGMFQYRHRTRKLRSAS